MQPGRPPRHLHGAFKRDRLPRVGRGLRRRRDLQRDGADLSRRRVRALDDGLPGGGRRVRRRGDLHRLVGELPGRHARRRAAPPAPTTATSAPRTSATAPHVACQHPAGNAGTVCRAQRGLRRRRDLHRDQRDLSGRRIRAASTVCRAAAGECDVAETCTGTSASCPADTKKPSGTACTDDGNVCTKDQCDGSNVTCQHPAGNAGTVCRAARRLRRRRGLHRDETTCPADGKLRTGRPATTGTPARRPTPARRGPAPAEPGDLHGAGPVPRGGDVQSDDGVCSNPAPRTGRRATTATPARRLTRCQSGVCTGNPVTCTAQDQCHVAGTCNPTTGACSNPAVANGTACNDGNACTQATPARAGPARAEPGDVHGAATSATPPGRATRRRAPARTRPSRTGRRATTATPARRRDTCQSGTCTGATR